MRRRLSVMAGAVTALLVLAACGGGTVAAPESGGAAEAPAALTIETVRGPVGLPGPATRVVSLEWAYTEGLMALGVVPVGVGDLENYGTWVTAPGTELPGEVVDVGTRNAPSLEQITALQPDLIIAAESRVGASYDALAAIAPVLSFDFTVAPQLETMKKDFRSIAAATGRTEQGETVLAELDARTADLQGRLDAAGRGGAQYALAQGFTSQGSPSIRMHTDDALPVQVLGAAGLANTWTGQPDASGLTTVGVEGMSQVPGEATVFYVAVPDDDPFTGALAGNPLWRNLPYVAEGRAIALDPGTWYYGGPASAMFLLDQTGRA